MRKVKEAGISLKIEQTLTKDEILGDKKLAHPKVFGAFGDLKTNQQI